MNKCPFKPAVYIQLDDVVRLIDGALLGDRTFDPVGKSRRWNRKIYPEGGTGT